MSTLRSRESAVIVAVQRSPLAPPLRPIARWLSFFGEHAAGWLLLGVVGAFADPSRFWAWALCDVAIVVAHGMSIVIKRVVRRPRPLGEGVEVRGTAPSKLSFPSSHASSTTAAAIVFAVMLPALWPLAVLVVLVMLLSRLVLGMHFPTDVLAGAALGTLAALAALPFLPLLSF
ncbi:MULTISPECIES: phosphatase PAP2 family protein [unclassified Rathayibacter]|uniref:phosphatase PAP2 family protein n=1 Tax=unclassified Rathayibacter TaxID=2609250 RepID=UPI001046DEDF|nr:MULTISPECIES: phosphatase PAP2 family protein [unclassified Rathayibacter]TCL82163.1 5'-phosphoribosyl-monophospho-decaprenol phosphatase [Rathayibacter sp. PhB192]TCM27379.1 5'-phosphoribosyl-monophospho-decaprenol phosphatase [Rathayibacter sp. PhB179]